MRPINTGDPIDPHLSSPLTKSALVRFAAFRRGRRVADDTWTAAGTADGDAGVVGGPTAWMEIAIIAISFKPAPYMAFKGTPVENATTQLTLVRARL